MVPPALFEDLTKEFLFLPQGQNEVLTKAIQLEKMFLKFKKDKNYSNIFLYVEQLAKVAKHLRISERPVILALSELTRFMNEVRNCGKDLGFLYPEEAPLVRLLGPRKVRDRLAYRQLPSLPLPFPSLDCLLKGTEVSSKGRETKAMKSIKALCRRNV